MKVRANEDRSVIKISVRNLVEFIMREGDIDNRVGKGASAEAMQEGSRIHRKIQRRKGSNYHAEVPLKLVLNEEKYDLVIEGRADGIQIDAPVGTEVTFADNFNHMQVTDEMHVTIDEIKGIYRKLDTMTGPVMVHKAQAMCYAYIYALQHDIARIGVQMTYCNLDTEDIRYFNEEFTFEELQEWFTHLVEEYKKWADFQYEWRKKRQESIQGLQFPYEYRKGQKDLAAGVYRTINRRKNLFIQAPTGVGKTISTVFPAVKAVGEDLGDRIFYLTAKTITGTVAKEAFELLRKDGYQAKIIQITAKEKMFLCEEMECNPVHCPYAKGHYDRV
ncbi:MAG: ATP-dependent DNA helicase, partial [Lachnospiraceae bacterium]|nr:ATP-dependent DNA helicase [Lachnospiraceae bacterium]